MEGHPMISGQRAEEVGGRCPPYNIKRIMPNYRRAQTPGGTFFFTLVTHLRQPVFADPLCRDLLRHSIEGVRNNHPFTIDAWVLLPDHLHCLWTLPEGDANFSKRWGMIKASFTKALNATLAPTALRPTFWQKRFWEHCIRDEQDLRQHMDYIHYNPVKHSLAETAADWPYSTFHRHVKMGNYPPDWATPPTDLPIIE